MAKNSVASALGPAMAVLGLIVVIIAGVGGIISNCPSIYLTCAHSPLILILEAGLVLILLGTFGLVYYKHVLYLKALKKGSA